jgi:hypothetical protein
MTILNVLVYVALIGYVVFKKVQGQPVKTGRKLFVLPVVLVVLGYGDVTQGGTLKPIEITLSAIGAALSLGLGLLRGRADKLSERDGSPFVQWGAASLILFVGNLAAKLVLDLVGIVAGSTSSAVGKSLLLTLGLTLLGEAIVIWMRTGGATGLLDLSRAGTAQPRQPTTHRFIDETRPTEPFSRYQTDDQANTATPPREPVTPEFEPVGRSGNLADALERHHNHRDHDHRHRHGRERS